MFDQYMLIHESFIFFSRETLLWLSHRLLPKVSPPSLSGAIEVELKQIIGETCKTYGWTLHSLEVMPDHVHLFVQIDHTTAPVEVVKTVKSTSAVKLFTQFPDLKKRKFWGSGMWSDGAYYATVGGVSEEAVRKYIEEQKIRAALFDA